MGPTGSGKSTSANAMVKGPDGIEQDENNNFVPKKKLEHNGKETFKVGYDTATSCTDIPGIWPVDGQVYLVDCAGFGDSNHTKEISNVALIRHVINLARNINVCFIVRGCTLQTNSQQ